MAPKIKGCMNLGPKSLIQWICREWVEKLGFNELDNKYSGFRSQENENRLVYVRRSSSAQSEEINSYIFLSSLITNSAFDCYSVFPLISRTLSLIVFFFFYPLPLPSSLPSKCRLDCLCWSLSHQHLSKVSGE